MNRILFCAATREELEAVGLRDALPVEEGEKVCRLWQFPGEHASLAAVTGTGTPVTLLRLLPLLERYNPSLIINTGIAGAYRGSGLEIGDIVIGESEVFADLGMELPDDKGKDDDRHEGFYPLGEFPFADEALRAPPPRLWG
jgi:nucleoside phosphorylase